MRHPYAVRVAAVSRTDDLPGRFTDSGLRELVAALDGTVADGEDPWEAIRRTFAALDRTQLAERLLDAVLLQPPIPAGCEALVRAMQDPATAPWRTHEVREDRVWLWYAHRLMHAAFPEEYPAPTVLRVELEVTMLDPAGRPPGARTPPHDRNAFVARLLATRPGDHPLAHLADDEHAWAYDVVWSAEVLGREKLTADVLTDRGASAEAAASGRCFAVTVAGWLPADLAGDVPLDATWTAQA